MLGSKNLKLPGRIGFFLVPDFSMIAFAAALEPLRIANRMDGRQLYSWQLISKDGLPVTASNGISVHVDRGMAAELRHGPLSSVILCSGLGAERYKDREVLGWFRRLDRQGIQLGALCTGSHILARAGLLDGYRCTIHWENLPGFTEAFPDIETASDLFEIDRDRFTCSGGTAALDMMLHLISQVHGEELASKVSEQCILDRARSADHQQRVPLSMRFGGLPPRLLRAIRLMEANLEDPIRPGNVASMVGLSRRHLERLFNRFLGLSPAQYYLGLRLERARHLLYQTELPILEIALACGFVSASHFSKCYRQMYHKAPRTERAVAA